MKIIQRRWTLISIGVLIPIGLYTKVYSGPLDIWVNNSLGGILYVVFWSLVGFLLFQNIIPWKTSIVVLLLTCLIEFLQLWHPYFLERLRSTFLGRTLLGTSFSWLDFLHYVIGFCLAVFLLTCLNKIEMK